MTVVEFRPGLKVMRVFAIKVEAVSSTIIAVAKIFIPILCMVIVISSVRLITKILLIETLTSATESSSRRSHASCRCAVRIQTMSVNIFARPLRNDSGCRGESFIHLPVKKTCRLWLRRKTLYRFCRRRLESIVWAFRLRSRFDKARPPSRWCCPLSFCPARQAARQHSLWNCRSRCAFYVGRKSLSRV